jgi:hypothetical protein
VGGDGVAHAQRRLVDAEMAAVPEKISKL